MVYDHKNIEEKWLTRWSHSAKASRDGEKLYLLFAFAYPSGSGLHVGHVESKTALDILARYYRMKGKEVFFPVGWDAFGLPAENYAIKTGVHPAETTKKAIDTFRRQIKRIGISYDWENEIATSHPEYYKWTQWLFLQLYNKGLAYKGLGKVNWCPSCVTVLANEQVVEGKCERCGAEVVQKDLEQWYFKITEYKDELISGLDKVDWPEATKQQQLNWIGKKEGVTVKFALSSSSDFAALLSAGKESTNIPQNHSTTISCFTTRIDTIFGVSFVVMAPEVVQEWVSQGWQPSPEVANYVEGAFKKTEEERRVGEKEKTGVDTGLKVINPVNGEEIPVWVADYVLMDVGTGRVMGVPAHDERDFAFAKKFGLPIKQVINADSEYAASYLMGAGDVSDDDLTNLGIKIVGRSESGSRKIIIPVQQLPGYETLIEEKLSSGFWNEYIGNEVIFLFKHADGRLERIVLNQENEGKINVLAAQFNNEELGNVSVYTWLFDNDFYKSIMGHSEYGTLVNSGEFDGLTSEAAMEQIPAKYSDAMGKTTTYKLRDWLISRQRYWGAPIPVVYDPEGKPHPVKEEHLPWLLPTDVDFKPTGESPLKSSQEFVERTERLYGKGWRPEYDTMDTFVDSSWYYLRYTDARNTEAFASKSQLAEWMPVDFYMIGPEHIVLHLLYSRFFTKFLRDEGHLTFDEPFLKMRHQGMILGPDGRKMSKSKGNVIDPDEVIEQFGADTLRMYEMFMGPIEADKPWNTTSVQGVYRFLRRLFGLVVEGEEGETQMGLKVKLNQTVKKVTEDVPNLKFNTAIAAMMELSNEWMGQAMNREDKVVVVKLLAPFAPFMAEELFEHLSGAASVHTEEWPNYDAALVKPKRTKLVVQVNGKVRAIVETESTVGDQAAAETLAYEHESVKRWIEGKEMVKSVFVSDKGNGQVLLNVVVR